MSPLGPHPASRDVERNPTQPGREAVETFETSNAHKSHHDGVLNDVITGTLVTQQPNTHVANQRPMPRHKRGERVLVPSTRQRDKIRVRSLSRSGPNHHTNSAANRDQR